jgi:hypothetical protein
MAGQQNTLKNQTGKSNWQQFIQIGTFPCTGWHPDNSKKKWRVIKLGSFKGFRTWTKSSRWLQEKIGIRSH